MSSGPSTCWTVIRSAAAGNDAEREDFARRYEASIRAYLQARWGRSRLAAYLDDAAQEVFLECYRRGGVLERADQQTGSFRAFLFGVTRNVARRLEERLGRRPDRPEGLELDQLESDEARLSQAFDRQWARSLLRRAAELQRERAREHGADAERRVELLHLRFHEDLPIRTIAARWQVDPARLHHDYARAREEFRGALLELIRFHHPDAPGAAERECAQLLALL